MYVKFPLEDLNSDLCPPHPTSIYTCEVTIASRVHGGTISFHYHALHVVGDPHSNNTARLSQISVERANTPSHRIGSLKDLDLNWLKDIETVAVTAGASTPTPVTKEVIDFLEAYDPNDSKTWDTTSHITSDKVLFKRK